MKTILVSAYACEPHKGSEQGVGWNWVLQLAKKNKVHVITRANNRDVIENYIKVNNLENLIFHYYDTSSLIKNLKNKSKGLFLYYFIWQIGIIPLVLKLNKQLKFDFSMHITFGSMWLPTFLPFINVPFIWGPIGGGDGEPFSFIKSLPIKAAVIQYIRLFFTKLSFLNPFFIITCAKSNVIIVRTKNMKKIIPSIFSPKVKVVLETSMEEEIFRYKINSVNTTNDCIRLITTGRLQPSKNIKTLIKALSIIPCNHNIKLLIIGAGDELKNIRDEIRLHNLENNVQIISDISRESVLHELSNSDIFLFPSLREGGSWALMEAMAIGLPVICLKWSGMEVITDDASAIRLPVTNPEQMPKDMAMAICKLIENPELMRTMGEAGRNRIRNEFNWDSKGQFMEELFKELETK